MATYRLGINTCQASETTTHGSADPMTDVERAMHSVEEARRERLWELIEEYADRSADEYYYQDRDPADHKAMMVARRQARRELRAALGFEE
jgi:hypothetical protein